LAGYVQESPPPAPPILPASRAPRRPRPPQQRSVGCGPSANRKRLPALRPDGHWMKELCFTIGSTLRVQVRDSELEVSVATAS
jgi:toxic protein SymE